MSDKLKTQGEARPPPCVHAGDEVAIGGHVIYAGAGLVLQAEDMADYDVAIFLRAEAYAAKGKSFGLYERNNLWLPIPDMNIVPDEFWSVWKDRIAKVAELITDKKVIVFCAGGHGRTGLFLACLLAYMEPEIDDPIAEIRRRYCHNAVETAAQVAQVERMFNETRRVATTTS